MKSNNLTFSQIIIIRLVIGLVVSFFLIFFISFFFGPFSYKDSLENNFKPIEQIKRIIKIVKITKNTNYDNYKLKKEEEMNEDSFYLLDANLNLFNCSLRQKAIIFNLLSKNFNFSSQKIINFIKKINNSTIFKKKLSCSQFIKDINIFNFINFTTVDEVISINKIIENHLTEQVSWSWNKPCIYFYSEELGKIYLSGSVSNCVYNKLKNTIYHFNETTELRNLANVLQNRMVEFPVINEKEASSINSSYFLTLDPKIQKFLNMYKSCFKNKKYCRNLSWKDFAGVEGFSITILDADTSEILGVACEGARCNENGLNNLDDFATFFVEVPPASVSKLIFGMAFSSNSKIEKEFLTNQIKTSGQLNTKSGKRNEWWEKQAICDYKKNKPCETVYKADYYASMLGIATACSNLNLLNKTPNFSFKRLDDCGLINLFDDYSDQRNIEKKEIYGLLGFIPINERLLLSSKGYAEFINWSDYNYIRDLNLKGQNINEYKNTSNIIQSVIGGGSSRITSLGLSSISSQIHQLSQKKIPILPFIIKNQKKLDKNVNYLRGKNLNKDYLAAKTVIRGMQKSLTPQKKGWVGYGTASQGFKRVFKKWCNLNCPIKGKTGTVSIKDPNYRGTTVFTAVTDTKKLSRFLNLKSNFKKNKMISIGVVVFPEKKTNNKKASDLHMHLIKDILFNKKAIYKG